YRSVTATAEFRTLERMRSDARRNEASALFNAQREGEARAEAKWQAVVAADQAVIEEKEAVIEEKETELASKDAEIERLRSLLGEGK
ncbi:MAG: hypothetical protein LBU58_08920, partial [Clostridiales bacterium]|nr:hypothetical protein [Clostridiales bacterium]